MYLRGLVNSSLFAEDNRVVSSIWSADGLASSFVFRLSFELNTVNRGRWIKSSIVPFTNLIIRTRQGFSKTDLCHGYRRLSYILSFGGRTSFKSRLK